MNKAVDAAARTRIVTDLHRSLLVEAGAGSGKTQKLAERMAAGVATGVYELDRMAAVTFTRKAAAELRGRFQAALEAQRASIADASQLARIDEALSNLERFFAGTIHAFCARLLRERPVEAGVSPGFTELDDVEEALLRRRSWRDYRAQARAAGDADVMELVDAGITAKQLDKAFETVCLYEDVEFPAGDSPKPDVASACRALEAFWSSLQALLPPAMDPESTCKTQERAQRFERQWRGYRRGRREPAFVAALLAAWESKPAVVQRCWPRGHGKQAAQLHEDFRTATVLPFLTAWRQYLYGRCVSLLTKARDAARAERRRRNALSFNDLLILTAEVLRTNADVRRALQQKYRWLFVDEFQDTDPIQAEIMFLLAADEETAAGPAAGQPRSALVAGGLQPAGQPRGAVVAGGLQPAGQAWRTVSLRPGALFVVGDPKQSIYRFRRADIEIYNDVRARLAGPDGSGVLQLTTNFRSVPGLCDWANQVFETTFPAAPTPQSPMFAPLDAHRPAGARGPAIAVLDLTDVGDGGDVAEQEAERIARYIRAEVDAKRRSFGDFLVLTRKKKSLRPYAKALEALEVPIEVTGAGAFDESEEVREIALLLGALADPQDAVSLVGVLRGRLFGLSDEDLWAWREAGGYFSLFSVVAGGLEASGSEDRATVVAAGLQPRGQENVASALDTLRRWHKWTRTLPAGAALERILDDSGYLALAATSRGGVEAGDLLHAVDRVRAVVETGFTLAEAADALAAWCGLEEDGPDESTEVDSLPLAPGRRDVVRLMNLHKAKGLEADVVFLADPFGGFDPRVDVRIVRTVVAGAGTVVAGGLQATGSASALGYFQIREDDDRKSWAKKPLAEPPGWDAHTAAELAFLRAEVERLMYVAATRAKDTLVIGRPPADKGRRTPSWARLTAALGDAPVLSIPATAAPPPARPVDLGASAAAQAAAARDAAHAAVRRPSWESASVTAEARRLPRMAVEVGDAPDATRTIVPDTPSHRADAGVAWGSLVHGLLEHAMRHRHATRDDLRRLALWLTVEEPALRVVIDQVLDTVEAVKHAPFWTAARASAECHEEAPFSVLDATGALPKVVTGAIDLVYRDAASWRLLDYKTDVDAATTTLAGKHAEQVQAYERAWGRVAGAAVKAEVVSVRTPVSS